MLTEVYREHAGRVIATLARSTGDLQLAEDCFQDAIERALVRWPVDGEPDNPAAWLTTVAKRRLIDRVRRDKRGGELEQLATELELREPATPPMVSAGDDRLELVFACCHPALPTEAQIALTLRSLGGLTTPEIARAFLVPEATMAQRLVRAKRKIKLAKIPFEVPKPEVLADRIDRVLSVVYLIFNEGYVASTGDQHIRSELCAEAISLGRVLADLLPDETEVHGLLALMLMHDSRREARTGPGGEMVVLEEQDRTVWDQRLISEARTLLISTMSRGRPGPYQVQAAISALHSEATSPDETDWTEIAALYSVLVEMSPTAVVRLNAAVAIGMANEPRIGLELIDHLESELHDYPPLHAARADLLRRSHCFDEAVVAYDAAAGMTTSQTERAYLLSRRHECAELRRP